MLHIKYSKTIDSKNRHTREKKYLNGLNNCTNKIFKDFFFLIYFYPKKVMILYLLYYKKKSYDSQVTQEHFKLSISFFFRFNYS